VHLTRLQIDGLRSLSGVSLDLEPGLHVFVGANGVGKTSILEAAALLGSGRSFRAGGKEALINCESDKLTVYAELIHRLYPHSVGFERNKKNWRARVNGEDVTQLGQFVRLVPVWIVEPNSHELITGGSERRRALIDWLMFHVEPTYGAVASRYRQAIKQRNAVLKAEGDSKQLHPWTELVAQLGVDIETMRARYWTNWQHAVQAQSSALLPELGLCQIEIKPSWQTVEQALAILHQRENRDRALGYTSAGPHRADWSIGFEKAIVREQFSRGQAKNACFAAVFGTLASYNAVSGERALLCLDDLFSELDLAHQRFCLQQAETIADQVLLTGIESSQALDVWQGVKRVWQTADLIRSKTTISRFGST
jgi:DNA replication and repair protein RecF